ncbi:MAG TPA: efflux transporter outer membrane subunit [Steroidobacteraceae bacterium]|jgi:NodT family efflux transporter outer membrane factor (OMF) lipoprotein|nr:efflux transporter outer membrane subunit [Steroidobacteraceae bacterium]
MRPRQRRSAIAIVVVMVTLAIALLSGCEVGPDFRRPAAPTVEAYVPGAGAATRATPIVTGLAPSQQWWTAFQSPVIDQLVHQAIAANPDLDAAKAALRAARENAAAQRGTLFPSLSGTLSATRRQDPTGTLSPTLSSGASIFALRTGELDVSYSLDLFGQNRRQLESLVASADAQRFAMQAAYLTLVSNTVTAAISRASLQTQIDSTRALIHSDRGSLEILKNQYESGSISQAPLSAQEAVLAQVEATLPGLEAQLAAQQNLLASLTGRLPTQMPPVELNLSMLILPQQLPLVLPSQLVDRRPDVRQAEAQLHAATADVGVATASMLPQITLSADLGTTATQLSRLLQAGSNYWSYGGSLSQTLFQGGALLHKRRAAVALMDQAGAQYRSTVLQAFRDVADTLQALDADARTLEAQQRAAHAAADSLALVQRNLTLGCVTYLDLLTAQALYSQAVISRAQAQGAQLTDTVALFQVLGGDWWNGAT